MYIYLNLLCILDKIIRAYIKALSHVISKIIAMCLYLKIFLCIIFNTDINYIIFCILFSNYY